MFIQITDPADNTRILLNSSCVLMVRGRVQGGSAVYLSTSASHHPDVLLAREAPDEIGRLLQAAGCGMGQAVAHPEEHATGSAAH